MPCVPATIRCLLFAVLCCPALATATPLADPVASGWQYIRLADDVTLYRKPVHDSDIPALLGVTRFPATTADVYRTISDYNRFDRFIPSVSESRILQREAQQLHVYQRLGLPLLIADRHYIIRVIDDLHEAASGTIRVRWQLDSDSSAKLAADDAVVPEAFSGYWHLATPVGTAACDAAYSIHVEPGGKLPRWVFAGAAEQYVIRVIGAVRKRLADQRRLPPADR